MQLSLFFSNFLIKILNKTANFAAQFLYNIIYSINNLNVYTESKQMPSDKKVSSFSSEETFTHF